MIITKYSALILEAALMQRPAISALLDGEDRFKVYGDLPKIVHSARELESLLERISTDDAAFSTWHDAWLARQQAVLPEYYFHPPADPAGVAADAVLRHLPGGTDAPPLERAHA